MIATLTKFKKTTIAVAVTLASVVALAVFMGGSQAAQQYDPNGTPTAKTPVFNNFYDVPNGVGNEADFVRVKPKAGTNADYVSTLQSACNTGESYNVRTYVHNGADPAGNGNGSGIAVAHNVVVAMTAELNKEASKFNFKSTISASNAASVSDAAVLLCGDKTVKLQLVPGSVETYSKFLGFQGAPDSAVNGSLKIGSRTQGSGDVWACWDDRVIVVYEVKVVEVPKPSTAVCKTLQATILNQEQRRVRATVTAAVQNATVLSYEINWGDGSTSAAQGAEHTYAADGTYDISGRVNVRYADGRTAWVTSNDCKAQVKFKAPEPKPSTAKCENLTATILNQDQRRVRAAVTSAVQNATVLGYEINWGDGSTSATQTAEHTYAADGTYNISARVQVRYADGTTAWVTSNDCKAQVKFKTPEPPKEIKVCELATKKIVTIKESDFDSSKYSKNLDDCKEEVKKIKVCELKTGNIVTIKEEDFDDQKYSKNLDDCKKPEEKKIEVCELATKKVIEIKESDFDSSKHSKDLSDCDETPVTPPEQPCVPGEDGYDVNGSGELCVELPKTGAASTVAIFAAVSAISALGYRFFLGRRNV